MRKAKYSSYKPSKTLWQSEIPSHWQETEIRMLFSENKTKNIGLVERNLLSLSYGKLKRKDIDNATGLVPASFEGYQIIENGYIVLRFTDLQNDKKSLRVGYANERGIITSAYVGLSPKADIHSKYFYYQLHFLDKIKYFYNLGGGVRQSLSFKEFGRETISIPEKDEQISIVKYLDFKLAKAEKFISKKKQLIKLLKEQKAAIINQAVTKGLDPNAKMKDSGIEWLGEIPEHWEWTYLRRFCKVYSGGTPSKDIIDYWENGTIPWLASGEVNKRFVREADIYITEDAYKNSSAKWIPKGSLIIALAGQGKTKGMVATIENPMTGNQSLAAIIPNNEILDYLFLSFYIESKYKLIRGFVGDLRDGLNLSHIKSIPIPLLPLEEQIKIANFIKSEHFVINTTISTIEKELSLVEEYKTVLIAEAVTGKIDVRGYVVPEVKREEESYEDLEEEHRFAAEDEVEYEIEELE
jgi:type I restriction enzyme S subunit